jgi:hypothetical protein
MGEIMSKLMYTTAALAILAGASQAHAALHFFRLEGKAGIGLLSGNENHAMNPGFTAGSGGLRTTAMVFDDASRSLSINFGWGSANGFTNLSGNATLGHIHGPTAIGGISSFTQNASVRYVLDNLAGWNNNASSGGFIGSVTINVGDVAALFDGKFYVNVHTSANAPGELRGNIVLIPAPGAAACLGLFGLVALRRKR